MLETHRFLTILVLATTVSIGLSTDNYDSEDESFMSRILSQGKRYLSFLYSKTPADPRRKEVTARASNSASQARGNSDGDGTTTTTAGTDTADKEQKCSQRTHMDKIQEFWRELLNQQQLKAQTNDQTKATKEHEHAH